MKILKKLGKNPRKSKKIYGKSEEIPKTLRQISGNPGKSQKNLKESKKIHENPRKSDRKSMKHVQSKQIQENHYEIKQNLWKATRFCKIE